MKRGLRSGILSAAIIASCANRQGQSNVYSLAIYSGGTSYLELLSLNFPFYPYRYTVTKRSRFEDGKGLVILGNAKAQGGVLHEYLDVEIGSKSFTLPLSAFIAQNPNPPPSNQPMLPTPR